MAQLAEAGSSQPTIVTAGVVIILGIWSLYALAGAGVVSKLPLLRTGLCIITAIYLIRGTIFIPLMPYFPDESPLFVVISSCICFIYGIVHLLGLRQVWHNLK